MARIDLVAVELAGVVGDHQLAVAQDGDAVGMGQRFFQRMADEDDGHAARLQPPHQREEMPLLLRRQAGGRLVEDDHLGLVMHGAGDLHHLPLGGAQAGDDGRGIDGEIERLQELLGGDVDAAQAVEEFLVAEIEVLRHGHRRHQAGFLEHHGDALAQRRRRRGEVHLLAAIEHAAAGGLDDAGHDLGQRRFAGAVLAQQRVDLALAQIEIDLPHRRHAAIGLGDLLHPDDRFHGSGLARAVGAALPGWRRRLSTSPGCGPSNSTALVMPWRVPLARLWKLATGCIIGIQPHHQPIGAARRPGLVDAHGLDAAALQRLQEAAAATTGPVRSNSPAAPRAIMSRGTPAPAARTRSAGCAARTASARRRRRRAGDSRAG